MRDAGVGGKVEMEEPNQRRTRLKHAKFRRKWVK